MKATAATRRSRGLTAGLLTAVLLPGGATAMAATAEPEAAPAARITLGENSLGFAPEADGDAPRVVEVDDTHATVVPRDKAYGFLGEQGSWYWETADVPWDTTGIAAGALDADGVDWSLTAVEGPGAVVTYDVGADGEPTVRFDSEDGLPDVHRLPVGEKGGARWSFGAPGTYRLTFGASGSTAEGEAVHAETVYEVRVGDAAIAQAAGGEAAAPHPAEPDQTPAAPGETGGPVATPQQPGTAPGEEGAGAGGVGPLTRELPARAAASATDTSVVSEKKVLDEGHIDIAARVVDGKMQIHIKDGTIAGKTTWREPSSVVLHVKPDAKKEIPAAKDFAFLGKAGDPVWLLDQVQQDGLLWPGWSTENIEAGKTKGGVEFKLAKADGPGNFALYNYDGLSGATVRFNSADGVPDSFDIPQNSHAHGGWAFGKEGVFRLTLTMTGTLADGTKTSDTETIAFAVGETDPNSVKPGDGSGPGPGSGTGSGSGSGAGSGSGSGAGSDSGTGSGSGAGSGSGSGDGSGTSDSGDSGSMASTGAGDPALLGATAAGLAGAGVGAVWLARRRSGRGTPA